MLFVGLLVNWTWTTKKLLSLREVSIEMPPTKMQGEKKNENKNRTE